MEKKRSKGVTIFGWSFIIINAVSSFTYGHRSPLFNLLFTSFKRSSLTIFIVILIFYVLYYLIHIIAGISILKLKGWGKKLGIILAIFGIVKIIALAPISHKRIEERYTEPKLTEMLEKQYERLPESTKLKFDLSKEKHIEKGKRLFSSTKVHIMHFIINEIIPFMYMLLIIFFFTRPKVKEQFK